MSLPKFICVSVGETCGLPKANTVRPYRVPKISLEKRFLFYIE